MRSVVCYTLLTYKIEKNTKIRKKTKKIRSVVCYTLLKFFFLSKYYHLHLFLHSFAPFLSPLRVHPFLYIRTKYRLYINRCIQTLAALFVFSLT